ncbi:hypothetical protein DBV15_09689 [Temnothorax longispinosus]|uniref:Uncharacterized protein n=1 Tax=Temnothorax longispinosus TaxID=300112 RepID=A0A4S2JYH0_9HYME|nr:hypothetical protein DBV15_09689 [Temnothorax longispinosus]
MSGSSSIPAFLVALLNPENSSSVKRFPEDSILTIYFIVPEKIRAAYGGPFFNVPKAVLSHCDLLMISDRYYSSPSIASITLTSRVRATRGRASLRGILGRARPAGARAERIRSDESEPPRVDGFRRRVKSGKEGLGCVSLPPSGAHLPSPQQSRTVRSGQEPRWRSQTAGENFAVSPTIWIFPLTSDFLTRLSIPPSPSCHRYFRPSVGSLSVSLSRLQFCARYYETRGSTLRSIRSICLKNLQHLHRKGDGLFYEDRVSRDGEIEDAPVAGVGDDSLATAAMVMVVVVVVLVPVKKRKKKKKKRKKKTTYIGGGNSSLLPRTGGGKATLKDRGDVVLAGTRRVFAHVASKLFYASSVPYVLGTFGAEEEKETRRKSREKKEKEEKRQIP